MLSRITDALNPQTETSPTRGVDVTPTEAFDVLSNSRRRHVLEYLGQAGVRETATIGEVVEYAAVEEFEKPMTEVSDTERKRIYVSLYQTHLPGLDTDGFVEYDDRSHNVTLTDRGMAAAHVLKQVRDTLGDGGDSA